MEWLVEWPPHDFNGGELVSLLEPFRAEGLTLLQKLL
jgi:hypothetical protein